MKIKKYTKKDGSICYKFQGYLGTDETTGERVRVTRQGFKSRKYAKVGFAWLKLTFDNAAFKAPKPLRFAQVYDQWLEHYKNTVKESTLHKTITMFTKHILPAYGHMNMAKIKPTHCQRIVNEWFNYYKNYKSLNAYTGMVFKYAMASGMVVTDPTKLITMPVTKSKPEDAPQNYYSKDELIQFFKYLEADNNFKWVAFFRVLAFTGVRRGEALALRWQDIDFNQYTITISRTLTLGLDNKLVVQTPKTKTSRRVIKVDDKTLSILKKWRTEQNITLGGFGHNTLASGQLVFTNTNNQFISLPQPGHVIDRLCLRHDFKRITTHGFRHTHCSLLFEAGATIKEVQDRLGHSDIHTTMNIYAHVSQKGKEETAEKFARYVNF